MNIIEKPSLNDNINRTIDFLKAWTDEERALVFLNKINELVKGFNDLDIKKLSNIDFEKFINNGNFNGSWQGVTKPTQVGESIMTIIEELLADLKNYIKRNEPINFNVSPLYNYTENFHETSGETWGLSQGMTYADNNTLVIAVRPRQNGEYNPLDKRTKLRVISVADGSILRENIVNIHYSNSLYYKADTKEILTFDHENIYYVDFNTLTITKTLPMINCPIFSGIFEVNNELCCATTTNVYKINSDGTCTQKLLFKEGSSNNPQSVTYDKGYYYVLHFFPNTITVYNESGNIINQFTIPYNVQGMNLTEIEDISINGTDVYLNFNTSYKNEDNINIVTTSLTGKCFYESLITTYINSMAVTLYVDQNYKGSKVGGTQEYPYKSLGEALSVAKSLYGNGVTIVINGDSNFKNVRFNNCNLTISCNKDNNIIFENPIFNGGNVEIIHGTIRATSPNTLISLTDLKLIAVKFETTEGNNINIDSANVSLRSVIDSMAQDTFISCNGSTIISFTDYSQISNKIKKLSKDVTLLNWGCINIQGVNDGQIATLPQNITEIIVVTTVANNYKVNFDYNVLTPNFVQSFTHSVDQGGGYDKYIVNFALNNNVLSFQKNVKFSHQPSGVITRTAVADALDKSEYPKVTHVLYK